MKTNKGKVEYNEVLAMLDLIPSYDYYKIPSKIIMGLKIHSIQGQQIVIQDNNFSNISRKAYMIFIKIYRDYIANKEEKEKLNDLLELNDKKRQEEYKNILKSKERINKKENANEIVRFEEKSFIMKILEKIKRIIKR